MKLTLAALALAVLASPMAKADTIRCSFTEPFFTTTLRMSDNTLAINGLEMKDKTIKNVSLRIKSAGEFEVVSSNGEVLQVLTLNNQGSDGMSNFVFPFDVKDMGTSGFANGGVGGCESDMLKRSGDAG